MQTKNSIRPVDFYIGRRLNERRMILGLSQEALGAAIGLTFQQIQKYERGTNRISGSRLWDIAQALQVQPGYFFEGFSGDEVAEPEEKPRAMLQMARYMRRLSPDIQERMLDLARAMVGAEA